MYNYVLLLFFNYREVTNNDVLVNELNKNHCVKIECVQEERIMLQVSSVSVVVAILSLQWIERLILYV